MSRKRDRRAARREPRPARPARPRDLRHVHAGRARDAGAALRARAGRRGHLLADQPRGRVLRDAAPRRERADGLILNPGAWTHYSYAIRDALEVAALPAVEVHISEVDSREEWRRISVIRDLCVGRVQGKGVDGYREALEMLHGGAGLMSAARADRAGRGRWSERELDSLLVTDLVNVRYLTGFTGTNGAASWSPATGACSSPTSATSSRPRSRWTRLRAAARRAATCSPTWPRS